MRRQPLLALLLVAFAAFAPAARADDAGLVSVRLGNAAPWLGGPSRQFVSPQNRLLGVPGTPWTASLPGWLRWALEPQVQVMGVAATAGTPSRSYQGMSWSVPLASGLMHQDDTLSFGFSLGQSFGNLMPDSDIRDRRLLPSPPLLRLGAGLGYQVTPRLGLYVLFDHSSSTGPVREDESENDLGIRVGLHF